MESLHRRLRRSAVALTVAFAALGALAATAGATNVTFIANHLAVHSGVGQTNTVSVNYGRTPFADRVSGTGAGADKIYGSGGNDSLSGGLDNDYIRGGFGNDSIFGLAGNDTLHGDAGNDYVSGSTGNDLVYGEAGT